MKTEPTLSDNLAQLGKVHALLAVLNLLALGLIILVLWSR